MSPWIHWHRNHWHVYKKQALLKIQWLPGVSFGNKMPQVTKSRSGTKKWSVSYYVTIYRNVLSECSKSYFPSWTQNILPWFFMGKKSLLITVFLRSEEWTCLWCMGMRRDNIFSSCTIGSGFHWTNKVTFEMMSRARIHSSCSHGSITLDVKLGCFFRASEPLHLFRKEWVIMMHMDETTRCWQIHRKQVQIFGHPNLWYFFKPVFFKKTLGSKLEIIWYHVGQIVGSQRCRQKHRSACKGTSATSPKSK